MKYVKKYKLLVIWLIIVLLAAVQGYGQFKPLTLRDAILYALKNKAEARKSRLDMESAEYSIAEVRAGALPQISGSGSLTYSPILQMSALPGEIFSNPVKQF